MAVRYKYKPGNKSLSQVISFFANNKRNISLLLLSVVLIISFSFLSDRITGYVTYTSDLESVLNETIQQLNFESRAMAECDSNLDSTKTGLNICNDKLGSSQSYLTTCEKERGDLKSYSDNLNSVYAKCDSERTDLQSKYANSTESYKSVIRNSVRAICCSFGDTQSGAIRSWEILNNQIVCNGNYSVNCTSGATNY